MRIPLCVHVGPSTPDHWRTCAAGKGVEGRCRVLVECRVCESHTARQPGVAGPKPTPTPKRVPLAVADDCAHRGAPTGETVLCPTCRGNVRVKVYACKAYGTCTLAKQLAGRGCCRGCPSRAEPPQEPAVSDSRT